MKEIKITELKKGLVKGVEVELPEDRADGIYRESYFEWEATGISAEFKTKNISGGYLRSWKHVPVFEEVELHEDKETFYFLGGTAIMVFADCEGGVPSPDSVQIVRIKEGTILTIDAGKGHFIAVAEDDVPFRALVVAPKMDAPRYKFKETVKGI